MKSIVATILLLSLIPAGAANFHPFVRGSWNRLLTIHSGHPTIIHFWSIGCAPCLVEMPLWQRILGRARGVDIVLVSTDPISDAKAISEPLDQAGLATADNWAFADRFTDKLYFEVNAQWQGELPYTVLIGRDGSEHAIIGATDQRKLWSWIASQKG